MDKKSTESISLFGEHVMGIIRYAGASK